MLLKDISTASTGLPGRSMRRTYISVTTSAEKTPTSRTADMDLRADTRRHRRDMLHSCSISLLPLMAVSRVTDLQGMVMNNRSSLIIRYLHKELLRLVKLKLDEPTKALIIAGGADLDALITGAAESYIGINAVSVF